MFALVLLSTDNTLSNAELKISEIHKCLQKSDVYFFGNSISRGTYMALSQILNVNEESVYWQSNITELGRHVLHNRKAEAKRIVFYFSFLK